MKPLVPIAGLLVLAACGHNADQPAANSPAPAANATIPDQPAPPAQSATFGNTVTAPAPVPEQPRATPRPVRPRPRTQPIINIAHSPDPGLAYEAVPPAPSPRALDLAAKLEKFTIEERIAWLSQELDKRGVVNVLDRPRQ
jgi:hypothetical protein